MNKCACDCHTNPRPQELCVACWCDARAAKPRRFGRAFLVGSGFVLYFIASSPVTLPLMLASIGGYDKADDYLDRIWWFL